MKYISLLLQHSLKIFLIFFLSFIWTRYVFSSLWLATVVSVAITALIYALIEIFSRKKNSLNSLKIKEKEQAENMFLSLCSDRKFVDFFYELARKENLNSIKKSKYILLEKKDSKVLLYPFISLNAITSDDIMKIYLLSLKENAQKVVIPCGEIGANALSFARSLSENILLLDKFSTYATLYKYYDFYPEVTISYQKSKKMNFKELFAYSFNKSRTKGYIFSAIILFLSTLFIRMNVYYTIMASLLVVFALISYFNPYFNKQKKGILN